jgi:hypothetical protein
MLRTKTLSEDDNPVFVVCLGHVNEKQFNDAFKAEGWSERGNYSFDDEYNPLKHEYWIVGDVPGDYWERASKDDPRAEPVTVANWD